MKCDKIVSNFRVKKLEWGVNHGLCFTLTSFVSYHHPGNKDSEIPSWLVLRSDYINIQNDWNNA